MTTPEKEVNVDDAQQKQQQEEEEEQLSTVELLARHRRETEKQNAATFECDAYESAAYWDSRYSDPSTSHGEVFEWYNIEWEKNIAPHVSGFIVEGVSALEKSQDGKDATARTAVVDLGCGNSGLVFDMAACKNLSTSLQAATSTAVQFVGVDVSSVVVKSHNELAASRGLASTCNFHQVDLTRRVAFQSEGEGDGKKEDVNMLPFKSGFASLVIDKATLDALDCTESDSDVLKATDNACEMLHLGGFFAIITCRAVPARLRKLNKCKGFALVEVINLENDPLAPSHVIVLRKVDKVKDD